METVINKYHIRVKKCCASCGFREVDDDGVRICTETQERVGKTDLCPKWKLSKGMQQAGSSRGKVRSKTTKQIVIH